jgi:hypothetical protein
MYVRIPNGGIGMGLAIVHADANAATTAAIVAGRSGRGMAGRGGPAGPADRLRRPGPLPRWLAGRTARMILMARDNFDDNFIASDCTQQPVSDGL